MQDILKLTEFPVVIYGERTKYNQVLSKARCRIFYKYENRNGTYITDKFADILLASLPYTPVKGIYDGTDFGDHGYTNSDGRIYGIVPENPNVAWEKHTDEDGVEREYACADVLLFTAIYKEADSVINKAQSMELYAPSMRYHTEKFNGQPYIVFDAGCFLGLQVLGEDVEPCFEGASFFSLQKSITETIEKIKHFSKGGQPRMDKIKFKLSDDAKREALWSALNPEFDEEHNWTCSYSILDIYDDYALTFCYGENRYERVYYTKNDEDDSVSLDSFKEVFIVDVTADELKTLDTLRELNGSTYELVNENLANAEDNAQKVLEYSTKNEELNNTISTLNTTVTKNEQQYSVLMGQFTEAQNTIATLNSNLGSLKDYKHSIESQQKQAVISEYSDKLSKEILDGYIEKIDEYSIIDLDKELAYELKKSNPVLFTASPLGIVPKPQPTDGIGTVLSLYEK